MLKFKFSSTQVNLSEDMQENIVDLGMHLIAESDVDGKGRELFPHITCKYGVSYDPEALQALLSDMPPFQVTLGPTGAFEPTVQSDNAAPIIVEVKSPELENLHNMIGAVIGIKSDDFSYRPHLTLAYVKPEAAQQYVGLLDFDGLHIAVNSIALTDTKGVAVEIPLGAALKARRLQLSKDDDEITPDEFADEVNDAVVNEWLLLPDSVRQALLDSFTAGISKGIEDVSLSDTAVISAVNTTAQSWARDRAAELIGMKYTDDGDLIPNPDAKWVIADTTRDEIRQIVADAFADETKMEDLTTAIREAGAFSDWRATMIAKTESSMAMIAGNYSTWQASGLVKGLRWLLSDDHDEEDDCDLNADEEVAFGEMFPSGNFMPPLHPNCWCSVVATAIEGIAQ